MENEKVGFKVILNHSDVEWYISIFILHKSV